jgi:hypothetical protein
MGSVVVLGGRSEIGLEVATRLASGRPVVLAARRSDQLTDERAAVEAAGATAVHTVEFDADRLDDHSRALSEIAELGPIDTVVLAFGVLGDQARAETDAQHAVAVVHTDFVAQVSVLTHLAQLLRAQGSGRIVVSLLLVRPGFVIGRMTEGMSPAPMSRTAGQVADAVAAALGKGRTRVWVPGLLRPAIVVMRALPQAIWRRMPR